ncbi:hypothetical protein [Clostridium sp.]|uniref:hypothetical protein n=1 Tax=Clostridium sp. TaxID=1506 RepID=UPI00284F82F7|nr:hypothetical protein [Clostridium sp.]MDR3598077.1 hypothetical protein [Clostridium sp.]
MDKRKYESKTLIAEYQYSRESEDFKLIEMAYRLKDGKIIMEYDGGRLSVYGLTIAFNKHIPRKGICSVNEDDFEIWKRIRSKDNGVFTDWEKEKQEQFEEWQNGLFDIYNDEHENVLKLVNSNELPF